MPCLPAANGPPKLMVNQSGGRRTLHQIDEDISPVRADHSWQVLAAAYDPLSFGDDPVVRDDSDDSLMIFLEAGLFAAEQKGVIVISHAAAAGETNRVGIGGRSAQKKSTGTPHYGELRAGEKGPHAAHGILLGRGCRSPKETRPLWWRFRLSVRTV